MSRADDDRPAPVPPVPFPARPRDAHKGSVGRVLVLAGSRGMSGAASLAGEAALRSGAGLVVVASPAATQRAVELKTTCLVTRALPETAGGGLARAALAPLLALLAGQDALALGPGLGQDPETVDLVRGLVDALADAAPDSPLARLPVVLDADGLNALADRVERVAALAGRCVLTPHPGEAARLGVDRDLLARDRRAAHAALVGRVPGVVLLLKGAGTLVGDGSGPPWTNPTGNPGLATAGAGDVLTGVIAALLAAGLPALDAARLGAWLHGRAGDLAARTTGWAPLLATDVLAALAPAIREVEPRA